MQAASRSNINYFNYIVLPVSLFKGEAFWHKISGCWQELSSTYILARVKHFGIKSLVTGRNCRQNASPLHQSNGVKSTVNIPMSRLNYQLSTINYQLSTIKFDRSFNYCFPSTVTG
ncbi:MAG: hypothetical protein ACRC62_00170 [Microcoleus sp.]